jgi:hypothetical protein
MKKWCSHIHWQCGIAEDRWEIKARDWGGHVAYVPIPRSWRVCPICEIERPTRENIKAAVNRALQDGEQ